MTEDDKLDRVALGKKIADARKKCGLTSKQLAGLCDVNATYLRQIEIGKATPSLPLFVQIYRILGVSSDWLLESLQEESQPDTTKVLVKKIENLPPDQIEMFIKLADVILPHLSID